MKTTRPSRIHLHMLTAWMWSQRSVCKRAAVGCLILSEDLREIHSFGYNGPAKGIPEDACTGTAGTCGCIHAEANALIHVDARPKTVVCTHGPCYMCAQLMLQSNVKNLYYLVPYRDTRGLDILLNREVKCFRIPVEELWQLIPRLQDFFHTSAIQSFASAGLTTPEDRAAFNSMLEAKIGSYGYSTTLIR